MRQQLCLALFLMSVLIFPAAAHEPKPFVVGSIKEITAARQGKPFILGMWSLTCTHCRGELALLSGLLEKHPDLDLVLVSTDTPEEGDAISTTLGQYGLGGAQAWVFADPFVERLRFEIDPKWYGELPRTYFYDAAGIARGVSGVLNARETELWVNNIP